LLSGGWLDPGRGRVEQGVEGGKDRQPRVLGGVVAAALDLFDLKSERGATRNGPELPGEERSRVAWSGLEQVGQLPGWLSPQDLPGELARGGRTRGSAAGPQRQRRAG
jgi:hypothetical protein